MWGVIGAIVSFLLVLVAISTCLGLAAGIFKVVGKTLDAYEYRVQKVLAETFGVFLFPFCGAYRLVTGERKEKKKSRHK